MNQQPPNPPDRRDGVRRVRRMSNWTAIALIAGTIVTTGYLARSSGTTAAPTAARAGSAATASPAGTPAAHKTCVTVPVATSGGSGVTAQKPVQACGTGTSAAPTVVYVTRPSSQGDS